jgi:hypothetical protein
MIRTLCLILALLPAAARADKDMTGAEFLARVEGRTVYWTDQGQFFGAETFHDDRNVTWQDAAGNCLTGTWAEEGGLICFRYADSPGFPDCWAIFDRGGKMFAYSGGNLDLQPLIEDPTRSEPLQCGQPIS